MHRKVRNESRRKSQSGMTLIELMIAGAVLTFGLLAVVAVFATAIGNNGRSRVDSTATMLTQAVVEQITAVLARGGPPSMADCGSHQVGNPWDINTDNGGAALHGTGIDFTEASPPDGYHMDYVVCNGNNQITYDVRWNIENMSAGGTRLVTVSARPKNYFPGRFTFALPVSMRVYVGPQ
jgi:type II secretory pathway pseudopilin PulG